MIAQVAFDLPLEGPFDYLIPEPLASRVAVGCRVRVSFGFRPKTGFVVGLLAQSALPKLKPVLAVEDSGNFNDLDLQFARSFSAYYGCSLGETLAATLRNKQEAGPSVRREGSPRFVLCRCSPADYAARIRAVREGYKKGRFLILVPDAFRGRMLSSAVDGEVKMGTRSLVFETDGRYDCVIMVDEEDASYKQEQSPMYETRQVLLQRAAIYGFDVAFVGITPSVELMALVREGKIQELEAARVDVPTVRLVDLSNYKFIPGLVSPPVREALENALKAGQKGLLILNRKGSYRLTRCVDCAEILKCERCDSPLYFSRAEGKYLCRHCPFTAPGDTVCPKCQNQSWRSQGIGVEQVQAELKKIFPTARIAAFERETKSSARRQEVDARADILIATQAALRFQGQWQAGVAAFIDFDSQLNRLDMSAGFKAFSLTLHIGGMAQTVFIQTRNINHHVLQCLARADMGGFYDEELKLRQELGFSPFKHWVKISWRGPSEKSTHQAACHVYNELAKAAPQVCLITEPAAEAVARKRGQFRFQVMVQADEVPPAVAFIKSAIARVKRTSGVITTINVDP
ncbi:MAG: hypothetical protein KGK03_03960 [Candidatus Omnitrophica bacterium]|nr:hypothetical protein [Candidatus Omnitrophota bacterium]MDE2222209.1 hypothetical protein [Candidatus Omnitrophota bacterium]